MRHRRVLTAGALLALLLPVPLVAEEVWVAAHSVGVHVLIGPHSQLIGLALREGVLLILLGVGMLVGVPLVLAGFVLVVLYPLFKGVSRAVRSAVAAARTLNRRATLGS